MDFAGLKTNPNSLIVRGIAQGTVSAGKRVSVKFASGAAVSCMAVRDLTTAAGDVVLGVRDQGRVVIFSRLFAAAPTAPSSESGVPDVEPATRTGSLLVYPVETRSYRSTGWVSRNDELWHGTRNDFNYYGCAFYGTAAQSLSGATVTGITVKVMRLSGGFIGPLTGTMQQITDQTKPVGAPTTTGSSITGPGLSENSSTTFTLPTAWGTNLVAGTTGGITFFDVTGIPFMKYAGRHDWSPSMVLKIDWSRVT